MRTHLELLIILTALLRSAALNSAKHRAATGSKSSFCILGMCIESQNDIEKENETAETAIAEQKELDAKKKELQEWQKQEVERREQERREKVEREIQREIEEEGKAAAAAATPTPVPQPALEAATPAPDPFTWMKSPFQQAGPAKPEAIQQWLNPFQQKAQPGDGSTPVPQPALEAATPAPDPFTWLKKPFQQAQPAQSGDQGIESAPDPKSWHPSGKYKDPLTGTEKDLATQWEDAKQKGLLPGAFGGTNIVEQTQQAIASKVKEVATALTPGSQKPVANLPGTPGTGFR